MRWLTFAIFAVLVFTLQSTLAPGLELFSARPDFLLILVVFLGLFAPSRDAVAAGWILGVGADLLTIERFGLLALSYGVTAFVVASPREYLFRYRALTQATVTFIVCLLVRTAWAAYYQLLYQSGQPLLKDWLVSGVIASAYTAMLAPFIFWALFPLSRPLGISRPRYVSSGESSRGRADV